MDAYRVTRGAEEGCWLVAFTWRPGAMVVLGVCLCGGATNTHTHTHTRNNIRGRKKNNSVLFSGVLPEEISPPLLLLVIVVISSSLLPFLSPPSLFSVSYVVFVCLLVFSGYTHQGIWSPLVEPVSFPFPPLLFFSEHICVCVYISERVGLYVNANACPQTHRHRHPAMKVPLGVRGLI